MSKIWKFFQYGYLMIAVICFVEGVLRWNTNKNSAYLFIGFSIFITLVFFLKRHFRKKVEKRNQQSK